MSCKKIEGRPYHNKYPVKATCLTTGTVYEWGSIMEATADTGFTYNMVKLATTGQLASYAGLRWETTVPLRSVEPSARIKQVADLYNQGLTGKAMADTMSISLNTVKFHLQRARALGLVQLRDMSKCRHDRNEQP
ncbi:MAG: hypothetical protein ACRCXB_23475 [Aeromonadaceae bacterium]